MVIDLLIEPASNGHLKNRRFCHFFVGFTGDCRLVEPQKTIKSQVLKVNILSINGN